MLPIRFAMFRRFGEASLIGLSLLFALGGVFLAPAEAGPLPAVGVDEFRALIDIHRIPKPEPEEADTVLAEYRRKLHRAAQDLPSLGEVARVLLLSEWFSPEYDVGERVPRSQVRRAVLQPSDEAFKKDVRKLMETNANNIYNLNRALVSEINLEVRLQLLERLEKRLRFYLSEGRTVDRIATAYLISDTLATSRRQDISQYYDEKSGKTVPGVMHNKPEDVSKSSNYLRERLRDLSGDLERLIADPNPQVRVAGIRALSDLEKEPAELVAVLKPLLSSRQSDASTRRAAAEALGHVLEAYTVSMDKDRPDPYLKGVDQVLPVAADGLADSDALVRKASLEACQRAAQVLNDLASDPLAKSERRSVFRPTLAVVNTVLPKLNASVNDPVPELRVGACHVLETIALSVQRLQRYRGEPLPAIRPEPSSPYPPPNNKNDKNKKKVSRPATRTAASPLQAVAFEAQPLDELPPPAPVDANIQGSVRAMIANLRHPDYRVRLAAVDTLETYGNQAEAAIPALVTALGDFNKFVRWSSARTLGRLHPRRAEVVVPGLMRLLDDREDPSVRIAAIAGLELYGEHAKKAVPLLARVINRGDKTYIIAILHAIQGIGTDATAALPNVAWILGDRMQPPSVRVEAAQTLGRFGPLAKEQLPVLQDVMNNEPDEDIRNAASTAVLAVDRPLK